MGGSFARKTRQALEGGLHKGSGFIPFPAIQPAELPRY